MKALYKEQLIKALNCNFEDGSIILKDSYKMNEIWEQLGHDWYIENNSWIEVNYNEKWGEKND